MNQVFNTSFSPEPKFGKLLGSVPISKDADINSRTVKDGNGYSYVRASEHLRQYTALSC
jgi:hypothetical protein